MADAIGIGWGRLLVVGCWLLVAGLATAFDLVGPDLSGRFWTGKSVQKSLDPQELTVAAYTPLLQATVVSPNVV
jgi:hypothetical protein